MANKIVTNHEAFRATEAKIAGLRGKIVDRLAGLTFNESSVTDALASWTEITKPETIGTEESGAGSDDRDVIVGHYDPALSIRWEHLD